MAATAGNVSTGQPKVGGAVYRAPLGSALPTDALSDLDDAFKALGYVSDDGLTNSNSTDSDDYQAWGGDTVLTFINRLEDNFQFTAIEAMSPEVLKAYYGDDNVSGDIQTGITVKANTQKLPGYAWVFDMILRDNALKRIVIPNGSVTGKGDVVYKDDDPIGYALTIAAMPDTAGNTHYEYIQRASVQGGT